PFAFLKAEWPAIYEEAKRAAAAAYPDSRAACFYARRTLELTVKWMYKHDNTLKLPYDDRLSALLHEPTFKSLVGQAIFNKARVITRLGNHAVHSDKNIPADDALTAIGELFHVAY